MHMQLHFTSAAVDHIRKMIAKENGVGFRLTIKKTGCSGYAYAPQVVTEAVFDDIAFSVANGVVVYVDPEWIEMLNGLKVDFLEDDKSGVKQKRLVFQNPNEANRCGCGDSFHVDGE